MNFPVIKGNTDNMTRTYFMGYPICIYQQPATNQSFIEVKFLYAVVNKDESPLFYVTLEQSPEDYYLSVTTYDGENKINYGPHPNLAKDEAAFIEIAKSMVFKFINNKTVKH